jgi:hypothetical protein
VKRFISRCHLLDEVMTNTVARWYLRKHLGSICIEILYYTFFTWLIIYNCGSLFCLQGCSHRKWSCLGLSIVLCIKSFYFNAILFVDIFKSYNCHRIFKGFWIF